MTFPARPRKLQECRLHGLGSELFVVEGDSAASSVAQVRKPEFQALLPMQGKPLNPLKATTEKVRANEWYAALVQALGAGFGADVSPGQLRYERVLLLMDPDPDGLHCGFLMQMFFYRWMRPLVEAGRLHHVWAPMAEVVVEGQSQPHHAYSEPHLQSLRARLQAEGKTVHSTVRHRGLASLGAPLLAATCVAPATRTSAMVTCEDVRKIIQTFHPESKPDPATQLNLL